MNQNYNPDWSNYSNLSYKNLQTWLPKIVCEECIICHAEMVKDDVEDEKSVFQMHTHCILLNDTNMISQE